MAVYAISDPHFGHKNILQYREEFRSIELHDEFILNNILRRCGKRDSLYILGDVAIGRDSFECIREIASHVEHLHIVLGNHDDERTGSPTVRELLTVCRNVYGMKRYKRAWLTHAPIHPVELRGRINVHGHVHRNSMDDPRYFNVSCEAIDYTPINMADIFEKYCPVA